eukprot:299142-Pleurochrysis_carterae.AAC.3
MTSAPLHPMNKAIDRRVNWVKGMDTVYVRKCRMDTVYAGGTCLPSAKADTKGVERSAGYVPLRRSRSPSRAHPVCRCCHVRTCSRRVRR